MKTTLNIDLKTIIIIVVVLLIGFGGGFTWLGKKLNSANTALNEQISLNTALQDSVRFTTNKWHEEEASKLALQANLDVVWDRVSTMTENQKELLRRIKGMEKENTIISAALVRTEAKLDSVRFKNVDVGVNKKDSLITFKEINDSITFDIEIGKAFRADPIFDPTITFNSLRIPNEQFIKFYWAEDAKRNDSPAKFSISNSNPLLTTYDVDSYIIPEINKDALQPTGWKKAGNWLGERKNEVIVGGVCIGLGTLFGVLIAK